MPGVDETLAVTGEAISPSSSDTLLNSKSSTVEDDSEDVPSDSVEESSLGSSKRTRLMVCSGGAERRGAGLV